MKIITGKPIAFIILDFYYCLIDLFG